MTSGRLYSPKLVPDEVLRLEMGRLDSRAGHLCRFGRGRPSLQHTRQLNQVQTFLVMLLHNFEYKNIPYYCKIKITSYFPCKNYPKMEIIFSTGLHHLRHSLSPKCSIFRRKRRSNSTFKLIPRWFRLATYIFLAML